MYGRVVQSRLSSWEGSQVVARGLYRDILLVCYHIHRNEPEHPIHLLHR